MLVLTRKSDEELLIDGRITVRVLSIDQGRVRLGISAPRSVPVARSELLVSAPLAAKVATPVSAGRAACCGKEIDHDCLAIV